MPNLAHEGLYPGLDYFVTAFATAMPWLKVALYATIVLTLLSGIVTEETTFGVLRRSEFASIHPTKIRELPLFENVVVLERSVIDELHIVAVHQTIDFALDWRKYSDEVIWQVCGWEKCDGSANIGRWRAARVGDRLAFFNDGLSKFNNGQIVCWSSSIIVPCKSIVLFFFVSKVLNISGNDADISAQLPLFLVIGSRPLLTSPISGNQSGYQCSQKKGEDSAFQRPFSIALFLMNVVVMGFGLWVALFWSFRHFRWLPIGCGLILVGWLSIAFQDAVLRFAENVAVSSFCDASATRYGAPEDVHVFPVVIAELKLGNVQRHIFGANLVIGAHDTTLKQRPKTINRLSVDRSNNIFTIGVPNDAVRIFFAERVIGPRVIRGDQTDFVGNGFADETEQRFTVAMFDYTSDDIAFALHCTDDGDFTGAGAAGASTPLVPMFVAVFATDVGFVNLNNAAQFVRLVLTEASTNAVAHIERGFVGAETHEPLYLERAHSLFAREHKVDDPEPIAERLIRVLEDRPLDDREAIAARLGAFGALPVEGTIGDRIHVNVATTGAVDAFGPAPGLEVGFAGVLVREQSVKLLCGQLGNGFNAGHFGLPRSMEAV